MTRKNLIVIVFLILATGLLFAISIKSRIFHTPKTTVSSPTPAETITAGAKLMLLPETLNLMNENSGYLEVMIDSQTNQITGVQLEMHYDPAIFSNVSVEKGSFFSDPLILKNNVDKKTGRITYIIGITPKQTPIIGKGNVAILHFTKKSTTSTTSEIKILPESEVTAERTTMSVLRLTTGAQINL